MSSFWSWYEMESKIICKRVKIYGFEKVKAKREILNACICVFCWILAASGVYLMLVMGHQLANRRACSYHETVALAVPIVGVGASFSYGSKLKQPRVCSIPSSLLSTESIYFLYILVGGIPFCENRRKWQKDLAFLFVQFKIGDMKKGMLWTSIIYSCLINTTNVVRNPQSSHCFYAMDAPIKSGSFPADIEEQSKDLLGVVTADTSTNSVKPCSFSVNNNEKSSEVFTLPSEAAYSFSMEFYGKYFGTDASTNTISFCGDDNAKTDKPNLISESPLRRGSETVSVDFSNVELISDACGNMKNPGMLQMDPVGGVGGFNDLVAVVTTSSNSSHIVDLSDGDGTVALAVGDKDAEIKRDNVLEDGKNIIGRLVTKVFGGDSYVGVVVNYDSESGWFKVAYEDGDEEEIEREELVQILAPPEVTHLATTTRKDADSSLLREKSERIKDLKENAAIQALAKLSQSSPLPLEKSYRKRGRPPGSKKKASTSNVKTDSPKTELFNPSGHSILNGSLGKQKSYDVMEIKETSGSAKKLKTIPPTTSKRGRKKSTTDTGKKNQRATRPGRNSSFIGQTVEKDYGGTKCRGTIVGFRRFYRVIYEDGDMEDLLWSELEPFLVPDESDAEPVNQTKCD
ncbi:hypothetical protein HHK36_020556 [Tetracentron sinense]|uniref:PTM/DIR17-like Tudor domain-containing protein n=1 Tax=Tetracentron sinense TaxID=13715 RepID=A0A835D8G7_TETSI|nr:hypothetical protein HHK36_020556 [Tetracentron sinense]